MEQNLKPKFVVIGRVKRAHGTKGEVQLQVLTDYPGKIKQGLEVFVTETGGERRLTLEGVRAARNVLILKFEGIDSRDDVEAVKGRLIEIPFEAAEKLPPGSYWYHDIIGILVYDSSEHLIGRVEDIMRTGGNDVYLVRNEKGKEFLIPAIKEVIKKVDVAKRKMVIEPMEGLLE
jgi:16S rRNA processing protein RimM